MLKTTARSFWFRRLCLAVTGSAIGGTSSVSLRAFRFGIFRFCIFRHQKPRRIGKVLQTIGGSKDRDETNREQRASFSLAEMSLYQFLGSVWTQALWSRSMNGTRRGGTLSRFGIGQSQYEQDGLGSSLI